MDQVTETEEPQEPTEAVAAATWRRLGRNILSTVAGAGVLAGFSYLGYRVGVDVASPLPEDASSLETVQHYATVALPTLTIGAAGGMVGGLWAAAAVSGKPSGPGH